MPSTSPARRRPGPDEVRAAVAEPSVREWLDSTAVAAPGRPVLARAVRATVAALEGEAPGHAVELRVPPFAAAQCVEGPRHTRGTPPNVVETDARTWLLLATGRLSWSQALGSGAVQASGTRAAEVARSLPVVRDGADAEAGGPPGE